MRLLKSAPRQRVFVLGGFLSTTDLWAKFSDEWEATRLAKPAIAYFKSFEARHFEGEFKGWKAADRDNKVEALSRVIAQFAKVRVHWAIEHAHFEKYIRSIPVNPRSHASNNPYLTLFTHVVMTLVSMTPLLGLNGPCKFVFDQQGEIGAEAVQFWDDLKRYYEPYKKAHQSDLLGSPPVFEDDRLFQPLQAADLYVGELQPVYHAVVRTNLLMPYPKALTLMRNVPEMGGLLSEQAVRELRAGIILQAGPQSGGISYSEKTKRTARGKTKKSKKKPR
jgi:hypothetical protein